MKQILVGISIALTFIAAAASAAPVYGEFIGSGRACAGILRIGTKEITWSTPFSQCGPSRYRIVDRSSAIDGIIEDFFLLKPGKKCRYPVLTLTHSIQKIE